VNVTIAELVVADPPELWAELGFRVAEDACDIGTVRVRLDSRAGKRITQMSLRGLDADAIARIAAEGLSVSAAEERPADADEHQAAPHPNGVDRIDHVVAFSPDLDRTVATLEAAGMELRRIREEPTPAGAPRQAFFRHGEVVLECIQLPDSPDLDPTRGARLWGLAVRTRDMDETAAFLGDRLGEPRPAVQEGRTIATLRRDVGSTVPLAFMTHPPVSAQPA
jgi:catechol 2,3-dioxygenase-like lactoylglutathione lyase family enzyme